jgi:nondiscriminating aspartyl-tRNA synthetase
MLRAYKCNELTKNLTNIALQGWVHELRDLSNIKFILFRDNTGIIQCAIKKESKAWDDFKKLSLESVIKINGKLKKANVRSDETTIKNFEVEVRDIEIINKADKLPIPILEKEVNTSLSKRLNNRSLDIRKSKIKAIFKIQSTLINSFRSFFYKDNFIEIQPPIMIGTSTEGGTDLFKAKYFEKDAYLAQSPQLYKQLAAISWEKVFSTSPVFRAEKHNTVRHLNEARQLDIEVAFTDQFSIMKYLEEAMKHMVKTVLSECKEEISLLKVNLKIPKSKYLSYKETIDLLNKNGIKIKQGDDLEPEAEKKLSEIFKDTIIFVHSWPNKLKPFYIWPLDKDTSAGFDVLYNGMEISSGGQRVHIPEILIKNIKSKKLNPKNFKWYIDSFRFGAPNHSGWSIGLERITMAICNLNNIREACLFPRDRDRLTP